MSFDNCHNRPTYRKRRREKYWTNIWTVVRCVRRRHPSSDWSTFEQRRNSNENNSRQTTRTHRQTAQPKKRKSNQKTSGGATHFAYLFPDFRPVTIPLVSTSLSLSLRFTISFDFLCYFFLFWFLLFWCLHTVFRYRCISSSSSKF